MSHAAHITPPVLLTIDAAVVPYGGAVTIEMVRAWIRRGELPATKAGKSYLISPEDLAARLAPRLRGAPTKQTRETPAQRETRQLQNAGIAVQSRDGGKS